MMTQRVFITYKLYFIFTKSFFRFVSNGSVLSIHPSHTCMKGKTSARHTAEGNPKAITVRIHILGITFWGRAVHVYGFAHVGVLCAMRSTGRVTGGMQPFFRESPTPVCRVVLQSADITPQHEKCIANASITKVTNKCIPFSEVIERKRICL